MKTDSQRPSHKRQVVIAVPSEKDPSSLREDLSRVNSKIEVVSDDDDSDLNESGGHGMMLLQD